MVSAEIKLPHIPEETTMITALSLPNAPATVDARLFEEIVTWYLDAKRTQIRADTVANYRNQLNPFLSFWKKYAPTHDYKLSPDIMRTSLDYVRHEYLTATGRKPSSSTIFNCFNRLKQVFHWAYRHNCTGTLDLSDWCPILPRVHPFLYFPTLPEIQRVLDMPGDEFRLRDVAMMTFMLSTAARVFETSRAQTGNITFLTPMTDLTTGHDHRGYCLLEQTKGDRDGVSRGRYVVFCSDAGLLLKVYLRSVKRSAADPAFGLVHSSITHIIRRHGDAAGLGEISPHAFRRAFSDYWDEHLGRELRGVLKLQLGHTPDKSDVTQRHYINPDNPQRLIKELLKHHISPLRELQIDWSAFPVQVADGQ